MSDLIKREDAIKATWQEPTYADPLNILTEVRDRIEAIPSADIDLSGYSDKLWKNAYERGKADRPQGEWIDRSGGIEGAWNYCSVCGEQAIDLYDYCPNCGADMRKGADDYERAIEQTEHDMLYEPTYSSEDGSM